MHGGTERQQLELSNAVENSSKGPQEAMQQDGRLKGEREGYALFRDEYWCYKLEGKLK